MKEGLGARLAAVAAATVLIRVAGACTGAPAGAPPPSVASDPRPGSPSPSGTGPTRSPSGDEERLPEVVLTAGVDDQPSGWDPIATIAFGSEPDQLGYFPAHVDRGPGDHPNLAVVPRSFAVSADGSLWVLDAYKERVAHYSTAGGFLGGVGRFPWESDWEAQDLLWRGDDLLVLEWNSVTTATRVTVLSGTDQAEPIALVTDGRPVSVDDFLPGAEGATGWMVGFTGSVLGGANRWASLDVPGSGEVERLQGIPLAGGSSVAVGQQPGSPRFDVSFVAAGRSVAQPIRIRVVDPEGEPMRTFTSVRPEGALPGGLVAFVRVAPRLLRLAARYGNHPWFLSVSSDGSALEWDRLPEPTIADEVQERHLTVGADGRVYLMVADGEGVRLYRRS